MRRLWIPVLLISAWLGAAHGDAPSPVIYPDQRLPLQFDHAAHATRGATCTDCHAAATTSRSAVDDLLPGEDQCTRCHAIDRASQKGCEQCHAGFVAGAPVARTYVPPPSLKFDHAAHAKTACTVCHDLAGVGLATRDQLPTMATCTTCHDGARASADCSTCHLTQVGLVVTDLPDGALVPRDHGVDFDRNHAAAATRGGATCSSCHRQSDCSDCHTGVIAPESFHPGDYVNTHAVDARRNTPDCSTCHRTQSFCVACHERSGIGARSTDFDQNQAGARFHPDDWVGPSGSVNRHAREARANLTACTSCHREDFCLTCHTAEPGTPRISPHGPGWKGSARCKAMSQKDPRMCLRCHIEPGEEGCDF